MSYVELEKKIAESEQLNDAVGLQIDSVLQNLDKKGVGQADKQRMRAVMAALTSENMRLDIQVRARRVSCNADVRTRVHAL
jgi:hypothetical protein